MSEKKAKNTNSSIDSEESNKNEECLLGFSSQYRTNLYKEEDTKENPTTINDINNERNKKLSADSTSLSMSQENNNSSEINLKRISDISKEDSVPNNNRAFYDIYTKLNEFSKAFSMLDPPTNVKKLENITGIDRDDFPQVFEDIKK